MEEKLVFTTEEKDTTEGLLSKLLANDATAFKLTMQRNCANTLTNT